MYLLMPKYWQRVIGLDVDMGYLQAINPALIVIGIILFIPIANKFNIFKMLTRGAAVSAISLAGPSEVVVWVAMAARCFLPRISLSLSSHIITGFMKNSPVIEDCTCVARSTICSTLSAMT